MIKNPIRIGKNKEKLIPTVNKILNGRLTNRIIDVFGTATDVTINAEVNRIIINVNNPMIRDLLEYLITHSPPFSVNALEKAIKDGNMTTDFGFNQARRLYNENKLEVYVKPVILLALIYQSYNYQIRFNQLGLYNSSFSKSNGLTPAKKAQLVEFIQALNTKHVALARKPWKFYMTAHREGDVVLIDLPIIGDEYYNDNGQIKIWTQEDETQVLQMCEFFNRQKTSFILFVYEKGNPILTSLEKQLSSVANNGCTIYTNITSIEGKGK